MIRYTQESQEWMWVTLGFVHSVVQTMNSFLVFDKDQY